MQYRTEGETDPKPPVLDITPVAMWSPPEPSTPLPPRNGAGTAALVLGCLAMACTGMLFFLYPLGLVLAVAAVGMARRGRRRARYGLATNGSSATAGLALGLVALVLSCLLAAATVWFVQRHDAGAIRDCVTERQTAVDTGRCILDVVDQS